MMHLSLTNKDNNKVTYKYFEVKSKINIIAMLYSNI